MPPKQIPITFEDEDPKPKTRKTMHSEEDWSPQSGPAASEAEPDKQAEAGGAGEPPAKPKRVPRGRKPRASRASEAPSGESASPEAPRGEGAGAGSDEGGRRQQAQGKGEEGTTASSSQPERGRGESPQSGGAPADERPAQRDDGEDRPGRDRDRGQGRENFRGGRPGKKPQDQQRGGGGGFNAGGGGKKKKKKKGRGEGGFHAPGGGGPAQPPAAGVPDPSRFRDLGELEQQAADIAGGGEPVRLDELYNLSLHDLTGRAQEMGIVLDAAPNRRGLISRILEKALEEKRAIIDRGALEISPKGYGFIVRHAYNYRLQPEDSYVAETFIRRYGLKKGHEVEAQVRPPQGPQERCPAVLKLNKVMEHDPAEVADVTPFEDLVPYYPLQRILLEVEGKDNTKDVSMRAVDLLTPIGFGQRGLIVAPPRTGKTVLLQQIANSIATNQPEAHLIVLLIDERPEEVTDFRRNTRGEVVSSTFDEPADSHVQVAEMVIEKARRMVEAGEHVVILLDSITRLARAYNTMMPSSGKILSGGVEANALQKPKRFFGAARNIEGGGSLTILATALIDTGSRMDEVIFEEFKGTGNMELHLDRALVDKRVFPALNIEKSGTRKEELLYHPDEMNRIYSLRRAIQGVPMVEAMEMLVQRLKKTRSNVEFLMAMNR